MADKADDTPPEDPTPQPGDVKRYPVQQPDGSTRDQLVFVTHVTADGRPCGFPLGYADQVAEFAPGQLT